MNKKENHTQIIETVLESLKRGSSINAACQSAGVDTVTFWLWRKKDPSLNDKMRHIYDSRIQIVEDALYKNALEGNVAAQIFFLKNRDQDRWKDRFDPLVTNENHLHITNVKDFIRNERKGQSSKQAPDTSRVAKHLEK
jgi:hypothetical protein